MPIRIHSHLSTYVDPYPDPSPITNDGNLRLLVCGPLGLHCERPRLHRDLWLYFVIYNFEHLKISNFDLNSDSDSAFHSNVDPDPDPASITNAEPTSSGSTTLRDTLVN